MFEQHPVPQQISSYQFRLIGDMTIKQFFQLAGGALIGLLIYASPFPAFLKWPLIIFFVIMGAAFAFLPFQDRPLDKWLVAFFRSIYLPTQFYWDKKSSYDYFAPEEGSKTATALTSSASHLNNQIQNPPTVVSGAPIEKEVSSLDKHEENFIASLSGILGSKQVSTTEVRSTTVAPAVVPSAPPVLNVSVPSTPPVLAQNTNTVRGQILSEVIENKTAPATNAQPLARSFSIPAIKAPEVVRSGFEPVKQQVAGEAVQVKTSDTAAVFQPGVNSNNASAVFSPDASPPLPSEKPNVVVGQVMDSGGKIIEGAILEITDSQKRPVRALRTNKAGHFMIVTPLDTGGYNIIAEKEGYNFETVSFEANGGIIAPIAIRAK